MAENKGNKGFAGLDSMLSDVKVPKPKPPVAQERPVERPAVPERPGPATYSAAHPPSGQPTTSDSAVSVVGRFLIVTIIIVAIVSFAISLNSNNSGSTPSNRKSTPSAPTAPKKVLSPYEQAILDVDSQRASSLAAMLAAAQASDFAQADKLAQAIENLRKVEKPVQDKTKVKGARALNDLGLKAHKASNNKEALQHFFEAYRINGAADTEITENYGIALYAIAEHSSARKAFYSSLAMTPRRAGAWIGAGKELAISGEKDKALAAFALALRYTKSPRGTKKTLLTVFHEDPNPTAQVAARDFLVGIYSAAIPDFIRPVLGNLADVKIPVFLPSKVEAVDADGKQMELFPVNNDVLHIDIGGDYFNIPFASEKNCRAMYCFVGGIAGKKLATGEIPEQQGDPVDLYGGVTGYVIKDLYKNTSKLVFVVGGVQYVIALSADSANDVEAAKTAMRVGAIPVDVFIGTPALKRVEPPAQAPTYAAPAPAYNASVPNYAPPVPAYSPPPTQSLGCNIDYGVSLQTYGEGVTVELRMGVPGNSRPISSLRSSGGSVRFNDLCCQRRFKTDTLLALAAIQN